MTEALSKFAAAISGVGALAGIGYYLTCLWSAGSYLRDRSRILAQDKVPAAFPPVSILKPLKGEDPEIYESFRSHCRQEYAEYEIVFGVSDANDPAVQVVQRLRREFPDRLIQLIVCPEVLGANTKVSNLAQMVRSARYDHFIVSDSDIRVPPDYLRRVVAPLAEPGIGLVTCLYRGIAGPTVSSKLEALGISTDFCAGVLVARSIEGGLRFALGSTMAFRRQDLEAIGGFESFGDYLADDYELGKRIAGLGRKVRVSDVVVETFLPSYTVREFFDHQLRWARGVRGARPGGYAGLLFTFGWQWVLLALFASGGAMWASSVFAAAVVLRFLVAWIVGVNALADRQVPRFSLLIPLRDLVGVVVWISSFASNTVTWRGDRFQVKNGKLTRLVS